MSYPAHRQTNKQTDRRTDRQTDRQNKRMADKLQRSHNPAFVNSALFIVWLGDIRCKAPPVHWSAAQNASFWIWLHLALTLLTFARGPTSSSRPFLSQVLWILVARFDSKFSGITPEPFLIYSESSVTISAAFCLVILLKNKQNSQKDNTQC